MMARSFSNAKIISYVINKTINRAFATSASQSVAKGGARSGAMVKKAVEEIVKPTEKISWIPDPRTGCYRPENVAKEIDAAELRATLLKKH